MLVKLQRGNQKDCLIKVLNFRERLIIVFNPGINYFDNATIRVKFDGNLLKQEKVTFTYNQVANIYIVYEIKLWPFIVGQDFKRGKVLFWAVKLTTNADTGKYKYSGYSIGFDASGSFSLSDDSGSGKTVIIFGADIILSVHIDNKKEDILILCKVQRKS